MTAALYNTVRDSSKKKQPFVADEFNPFVLARKKTKRKGIEAFAPLIGLTPARTKTEILGEEDEHR